MNVKIEKKPGFTVLGVKERGSDGPSFIPPLWNQLGQKELETWDLFKSTGIGYGVMDNYDPKTREFDYLAGREAEKGTKAPQGLTTWDVAEQTYAVIECTVKTIMDSYRLFTEWCPKAGYRRAAGPEFELYPEDWQHPGTIYMYYPIEPV